MLPPLLIVLCAGPHSLHHNTPTPWLSPPSSSSSSSSTPPRQYDVAVLYYGEDDGPAEAYAPHTVHFERVRGPKWSLLRAFLKDHRALWSAYTFVAFPDDDLAMTPDDWNRLVDIGQTYQLDVFQPAIVPPASDPTAPVSRYIQHTHVMPASRSGFKDILRFVDMVEIMVPVFRKEALEVCTTSRTSRSSRSSRPLQRRPRRTRPQQSREGGGRGGRGTRLTHRRHRPNHHHPKTAKPSLPQHAQHAILTDPILRSGWGVDYALPQTVLPCRRYDLSPTDPYHTTQTTYNYAVVDAVVVEHTRPLGVVNGNTLRSSFYQTFRIDPEREMHQVMRKWRAKRRAPRTLRHVPEPVDYSYVKRSAQASVPPLYQVYQVGRQSRRLRQPYDTIELPTFLQSNLNRETQHVQRNRNRNRNRNPNHNPNHNHKSNPIQWSDFYYKLGYGFHARIHNNTLTVLHDLGSFQSRNWNTVQMLHEVLQRYSFGTVDIELLVCTDDKVRTPDHIDTAGIPILVMAKKPHQTYLTYPDHTFYTWNEAHTRSWERERTEIQQACATRYATTTMVKRPTAFFRGNLNTSYLRKTLADRCRRMEAARGREGGGHVVPLDVKGVDVSAPTSSSSSSSSTSSSTSSFTTLTDRAQYAYLLHLPGRSYAARLKYLLATNSDVIYVKKSNAHEYREFWYDGLRPGVNCWMVRDRNRYDIHDNPQPTHSKHSKHHSKRYRKTRSCKSNRTRTNRVTSTTPRYRDNEVVEDVVEMVKRGERLGEEGKREKREREDGKREDTLVNLLEWRGYWGRVLGVLKCCR